MDRGFMDGTLLWWLNTKDIIFYIPAKSNMAVYEDALVLADKGILQTRDRKRGVGAGKNKTFVTDHWEVAGIEGLTTAGFYGPHGSGSHKNRKDFVANPINAAVVLDNPFMRNNPNVKTLVILTNGPISKPLKVYDGYDARSEIENSMFREAKQAWYIQWAPENTRPGFLFVRLLSQFNLHPHLQPCTTSRVLPYTQLLYHKITALFNDRRDPGCPHANFQP